MENKERQENKGDLRSKKVFGFMPVISFIGIFVGILGGYAYYHFVGCRSGSCAITSNPWLSILWGAVMGYLVFDIFSRKKGK